MFTRSAIAIGRIDEEREAEFLAMVEAEPMPGGKRMPPVEALRAMVHRDPKHIVSERIA